MSFSMLTLSPVLILLNIYFVYEGDFADDGSDCDDGFGFPIYHGGWCGAVFLHAVECVASDCASFALGEHQNFSCDALSLQFMALFKHDACVGVYAAVEANRHRSDECFAFGFAFEYDSSF